MNNPFRSMMKAATGRAPLGTWVMSASPLVAEALGQAGFDWCVVDMEHSPLDMMDVIHLLQAVAGTPMVPLVRVPWNDTVGIKRALDAGSTTLLVPFVQDAGEARSAVAATRYPPLGIRGMAGMSRGSRFGTTPDYLTTAHHQLAVIVQIETAQAADRVDEIAAVDGVDALFIGPADLSASLGHVGRLTHPEVMACIARTVQRCKAAGKPVGIVGGSVEVVREYLGMGFDFVAIDSDLGLLMRQARAGIDALGGAGPIPASAKRPDAG